MCKERREPDRPKPDQAEFDQAEANQAESTRPAESRRLSWEPESSLTLLNNLSEISRLPGWIGEIAARYSISKETEFAINVCLEEAVSNVMRHGYGEGEAGEVAVRFMQPERNSLEFIVEDTARPFNPLTAPAPSMQPPMGVGGQGVHFLRHFTKSLEYRMTPNGNRLGMTFTDGKSEG
jgi:serine/threonine-protein kinase RsbW